MSSFKTRNSVPDMSPKKTLKKMKSSLSVSSLKEKTRRGSYGLGLLCLRVKHSSSVLTIFWERVLAYMACLPSPRPELVSIAEPQLQELAHAPDGIDGDPQKSVPKIVNAFTTRVILPSNREEVSFRCHRYPWCWGSRVLGSFFRSEGRFGRSVSCTVSDAALFDDRWKAEENGF